MKIGIFSGTFDPFTCAHYEIVNKIFDDRLVDKVIVIPTIVDYYRKDKAELFDLSSRREIIEKWFKNADNVILDFHEYSIATDPARYYDDPEDIHMRRYIHMLSDVMERCGSTHEYFTVIGGDSWNNLHTWYEYEKLLDMTKFVVVRRDESILHSQWHSETDSHVYPDHFIDIDKKFVDVSATKIRKRLEDDMSAMSLGPSTTCLDMYLDEVDDYLKTGKTYEDRHQEYLEMEKEAKKIAGNYFDKIDFGSIKREAIRKASSMKANEYLNSAEKYNKNMKTEADVKNAKDEDMLLVHTPIFDVISEKEVESGFRPVKIKSNDWVTIVVEKDGQFLMEKQFRYGISADVEEFPCGIVEKDELPIVAALRELREETGIEVKRYALRYLGKYAANPAFMTNYMHYFYIELKDFVQYDQQLDEHEQLDWYWLDKNRAFDNFLKSNGSALGGSCWMLLIREGIVTEWND